MRFVDGRAKSLPCGYTTAPPDMCQQSASVVVERCLMVISAESDLGPATYV
jgi:hypothetical protein